MKLVVYPDPILRRRAEPLRRIDRSVRDRIREMFEIMYRERGVGLAGPQVAWMVRLFVVNVAGDPAEGEERVYINPTILRGEGEATDEEGCLSIPEVRAPVVRRRTIVVRAQGLDGRVFEEELEDMHARAVQHENDHLDGILFVNRLGPAERLAIQGQLKQLARDYEKRSSTSSAGR